MPGAPQALEGGLCCLPGTPAGRRPGRSWQLRLGPRGSEKRPRRHAHVRVPCPAACTAPPGSLPGLRLLTWARPACPPPQQRPEQCLQTQAMARVRSAGKVEASMLGKGRGGQPAFHLACVGTERAGRCGCQTKVILARVQACKQGNLCPAAVHPTVPETKAPGAGDGQARCGDAVECPTSSVPTWCPDLGMEDGALWHFGAYPGIWLR